MCTVFLYVTAEKATLYRAIMQAFMQSKARFIVRLHSEEICGLVQVPNQTEIESALTQLCEWGNLQIVADRTDIRTAADFYNPRQAFQMTSEGEAAERAFALFQSAAGRDVELSSTPLEDIRSVLQGLSRFSGEVDPDPGEIRRNLLLLQVRFEDLTTTAQRLVRQLEQRTGVDPADATRLIDHAERFVAELVLATDSVVEAVQQIERSAVQRFLPAEWSLFRDWFISRADRPSNAELLRECLRTSIPSMLDVIARIKDRQFNRIDRSNDFRVLARWFAEAESDAEAHRLWRTVFGLCPARHLTINDQTLDDYEAREIPAHTSWLDAPPLRVSMRARGDGSQMGVLSRIIDRTAEKEKLAAAAHEEALRILNAQSRFGSGRRMRLSELAQLEGGEFDLFLDLLGEATSMEVLSGDGYLRVKLEPTNDGSEASIVTAEGVFSGPDHWISIEQIHGGDVVFAQEEVL